MGLLCSDQDRARVGEGSYRTRTFADKARKTSGGALEIPDKGYFTFAPVPQNVKGSSVMRLTLP